MFTHLVNWSIVSVPIIFWLLGQKFPPFPVDKNDLLRTVSGPPSLSVAHFSVFGSPVSSYQADRLVAEGTVASQRRDFTGDVLHVGNFVLQGCPYFAFTKGCMVMVVKVRLPDCSLHGKTSPCNILHQEIYRPPHLIFCPKPCKLNQQHRNHHH